jgi:hypothetical protein
MNQPGRRIFTLIVSETWTLHWGDAEHPQSWTLHTASRRVFTDFSGPTTINLQEPSHDEYQTSTLPGEVPDGDVPDGEALAAPPAADTHDAAGDRAAGGLAADGTCA